MHVMGKRRTNCRIDSLNHLRNLDVAWRLAAELSGVKQIHLALLASHEKMICARQHRWALRSEIEVEIVERIEI